MPSPSLDFLGDEMITKAIKETQISGLVEKFNSSKAAFIVNFKGMTVEQVTTLRKKLFSIDSEMKVVRNTLAKRALVAAGKSEPSLEKVFQGTNAVIFSFGDVAASAKMVTGFSKDVEIFQVKAGMMDGRSIDEAKIQFLATLPAKPVLQAQLLGVLSAPATKLARTFNEAGASLARVLNAQAQKQ